MNGRKIARIITLRRDGKRCVCCGTPHALTVHHIRPRAIGGTDHSNNLVTLCEGCHREIEYPAERWATAIKAWILLMRYGPRFWLHIHKQRFDKRLRGFWLVYRRG